MRLGLWLAVVAVLPLAGCASVALHDYVGRDLDVVIQRYGAPTDHQTLPNGAEAFRWVVSGSHAPGADKPLNMFMPLSTAPLAKRRAAAQAGVLMGGMCVYTILARWEAPRAKWRVVNYETPRIDCD